MSTIMIRCPSPAFRFRLRLKPNRACSAACERRLAHGSPGLRSREYLVDDFRLFVSGSPRLVDTMQQAGTSAA